MLQCNDMVVISAELLALSLAGDFRESTGKPFGFLLSMIVSGIGALTSEALNNISDLPRVRHQQLDWCP